MRAGGKLYSLLIVLIRACVAHQLGDVFTDLYFSYSPWQEHGICPTLHDSWRMRAVCKLHYLSLIVWMCECVSLSQRRLSPFFYRVLSAALPVSPVLGAQVRETDFSMCRLLACHVVCVFVSTHVRMSYPGLEHLGCIDVANLPS